MSDPSKNCGCERMLSTQRYSNSNPGRRNCKKCIRGQTQCWHSFTKNKQQQYPQDVTFQVIALGSRHYCGIEEGPQSWVKCWGRGPSGETRPPVSLKMRSEPSCLTEHPKKRGPVACTSCRKPLHHTIIDPKTNSGTCTKMECPFCKVSGSHLTLSAWQ